MSVLLAQAAAVRHDGGMTQRWLTYAQTARASIQIPMAEGCPGFRVLAAGGAELGTYTDEREAVRALLGTYPASGRSAVRAALKRQGISA